MNFHVDLNNIVLLLIGILNVITLYYTKRTEKNTNSMKDALVASTAKLSRSEGKEEGRIEGEKKASDLVASEKADEPQEVKIVNPATEPVPVITDKPANIVQPVKIVSPTPVPVTVRKEK